MQVVVIRVFVVDDHPALRTGLLTVLRTEPGLDPVGATGSSAEAITKIRRVEPDVAVVDYQLPDEDGLVLCHRLKTLEHPPRVLVYSAFSDPSLAIPALVAGVDAMVNKAEPPDTLLDAIRLIARGKTVLPSVWPELVDASASKLEGRDMPILGMSVGRTPAAEIAQVLRLEEQELDNRIRAILARLRIAVPRMETGLGSTPAAGSRP